MSTFGPATSLPFHDFLKRIGDDPELRIAVDMPSALASQEARFAKAKDIYNSVLPKDQALFNLTDEFVWCFGEFHQAKLFHPMIAEWRSGNWGDASFGALLRTLHKAGCTTSMLLDECGVDEFSDLIRSLPPTAIHTVSECERLGALQGPIKVFRGGWAATANELVSRGVSWSLSQEVADEFVIYGRGLAGNQNPFLLQAIIQDGDILALFEHEQEVVVHPINIRDMKPILNEKVLRWGSHTEY